MIAFLVVLLVLAAFFGGVLVHPALFALLVLAVFLLVADRRAL